MFNSLLNDYSESNGIFFQNADIAPATSLMSQMSMNDTNKTQIRLEHKTEPNILAIATYS